MRGRPLISTRGLQIGSSCSVSIQSCFEPVDQLLGIGYPYYFFDDFAFVKQKQGWNRTDAQLRGIDGVLLHVDLEHVDFPVKLLSDSFDQRG